MSELDDMAREIGASIGRGLDVMRRALIRSDATGDPHRTSPRREGRQEDDMSLWDAEVVDAQGLVLWAPGCPSYEWALRWASCATGEDGDGITKVTITRRPLPETGV